MAKGVKVAYPVEGVGKGVFTEVGEYFVVDLKSSEVCLRTGQRRFYVESGGGKLPDSRIASSEYASIGVGS